MADILLNEPRVRVTTERVELFGTPYDVDEIEGVEVVPNQGRSLASYLSSALAGLVPIIAIGWLADWSWGYALLMWLGITLGMALPDLLRRRESLPTSIRLVTRRYGPHDAAWIEDRTFAERVVGAIERARQTHRNEAGGVLGAAHG